jgi:uncharacterized membrane protein YhaH (DUF805 family)
MADMGFQTAVRTVFANYATFEGRARRAEYWWWVLFTAIARAVLRILDGSALHMGGGEMGMGRWMQTPGPLAGLFTLAVLVPSLAVAVRRLHDTGRSGWWLLLVLIPVVGWIVLLVFMVEAGEKTANAYGPDPIG